MFTDVNNADAELIKDECSARVKVVQIDASSDTQVNKTKKIKQNKMKIYL